MDDSLWNLSLDGFWMHATLTLVVVCVLGTPLSWHKTLVGLQLDWVGFGVDLSLWWVSVTLEKFEDMSAIAEKLLDAQRGEVAVLGSLAGKLTHAVQVVPQLRPLLQPVWAFMGAVGDREWAIWPKTVRRAIVAIIRALRKRRAMGSSRRGPG